MVGAVPPLALWITRAQAVCLVGLAVAVIVLALTDRVALGVGFLVAEVVGVIAGAVLLGCYCRRRRARTPILLLQIIAVGVSTQLYGDHRRLVAVAVGLPALVSAAAIVWAAREQPP